MVGDPRGWPHVVRGIGALIAWLERRIYPYKNKYRAGAALACIVALTCIAVPTALLFSAYLASPWLYFALEALLCWQLLATRSLAVESGRVRRALKDGDLHEARKVVSGIVGRDVDQLDEGGVTRATVETVAENASDGVVAPLFYLMIGGAPLGFLYKAINTMDSMIAYKNERYFDFGRFAARLDDAFNFVPSRLCALLMIASSSILRMDAAGALRVWRRDRRKHASPNSAQTESVVAGALGIQLAGDAWYAGVKHAKPFIGDDTRAASCEDIRRTNKLLYVTAALMLLLAAIMRGVACVVL
jgi:adenosylcobinamide-phosphate synthase